MMTPEQKKDLYRLLHGLVEDMLTAEQFKRLDEWLGSDAQAREIYADFMQIGSDLQYFQASLNGAISGQIAAGSEQWTDSAIWNALSEAEKTAPQVVVEKIAEPEKEFIQTIKVKALPRKINTASIYWLMVSAAALVALLTYIYYVPHAVSQQVATLTDCIDAELVNSSEEFGVGSRLVSHTSPLWLKKGIIKIEFDYGAEVILEGPAEIKLESAEKMTLAYGRLYANIPEYAAGFMVSTPYSKVIDMGTAFGVKVDVDGVTDVHMFKGKASLIPGASGKTGSGETLTPRQARRVSIDGQASRIEFGPRTFVRRISSEKGIVWRGENRLDAVNIAKGQKGYGPKSTSFYAINPSTGQVLSDDGMPTRYNPEFQYNPLEDNANVDGVFVPDGSRGPVVISSAGHVFEQCPDTTARWFAPILMEPTTKMILQQPDNTIWMPDISLPVLNGVTYGGIKPAMVLHANCGLTFDLSHIRTLVPEGNLSGFTATLGISETVDKHILHATDLWILVDGTVCYHLGQDKFKITPQQIALDLPGNARFMTLVATDGGETMDFDWWVVAEPQFVIDEH